MRREVRRCQRGSAWVNRNQSAALLGRYGAALPGRQIQTALARRSVVEVIAPYTTFAAVATVRSEENAWQCCVLRCLCGNPFRPPPPIPAAMLHWNQGIVRRLAEEAYQHRLLPSGHLDPERLAVLADALEEAGADAEMVEHLRGPGPHWRGCQVVDFLTGRE